jgi:hypothetical protein
LKSASFGTAFSEIAANYTGNPLKCFVHVVAATGVDVSELILANFENLMTGHAMPTIRLIANSPGFQIDHVSYTALASTVVQRCASVPLTTQGSKSLRLAIKFVEKLTETKNLV